MHSFKYDVSAFFVFCGAGLLTGDCLELLYEHDIKKGAAKKRVMGIEPTYPAWKAGVLPLNYTRIGIFNLLYNAQFRNRTRDTRIFSPLLYQLS